MCKQTPRWRIYLLWLLLTFTAPAWAQTPSVTSLAIDPATPTTLYAGTSIGVFKSTNGGATWSAPTTAMNVTSLSLDPNTPSTIYTNTQKSTNGGATWTAFTRPGGRPATVVIVDPNNPSTLYAGVPYSLYSPTMFRSTDGGATWSDFSQGLEVGINHLEYPTILSLAVDPRTSTVFSGLVPPGGFDAIERRLQTNNYWERGSANISLSGVLSIAIHPSSSQLIYATDVLDSLGRRGGVLKSVDGGATWRAYSNAGLPAAVNATAITIDPTSPSTLYLGTNSGIFKSVNDADTWTLSSDGFVGGATVNALGIDPFMPSTIYAATSIGVYKSSDSGTHWIASNEGLRLGASVSAPVLTSLSPNSAPLDSFADILLEGSGFTSPFGLNLGGGIGVGNATLNSSTSITARIQISRDAAMGLRYVTVTTANGTTNALPFTVISGSTVPPSVTGVSPSSASQGATATVTFTGTNFTPSMSGTISGSDNTIDSFVVSSSTSAKAVISIGATAPVGIRSIQISTLFGGVGNTVAFEVKQGEPVISSMSPPFVLAGRTTRVTFTGIRLYPPLTFDPPSVSENDPDVVISNVVTNESFTSVTVDMTVRGNARLKDHTLWLMSGGWRTPKHYVIRSLTRSTDFNGDGNSDLLWYNATTGNTELRLMNGLNVIATGVLQVGQPNWKVTATGDFDGDGKADLVWYNAVTGQTTIWLMNGIDVVSSALLVTDAAWHVIHVNDFNGDGKSDLVWDNGLTTAIVYMDGLKQKAYLAVANDPNRKVIATGDLRRGIFQSTFGGEGFADLLTKNTATNETVALMMSSDAVYRSKLLNTDPSWSVTSVADLDGDGMSDLLWYNATTGQTKSWILGDDASPFEGFLLTDPNWRLRTTADLNGDNLADLIWYNASTDQTAAWLMNGRAPFDNGLLLAEPGWKVASTGDFDGDGKVDLVWTNDVVGQAFIWLMDGLKPSRYAYLSLDANWRLITSAR